MSLDKRLICTVPRLKAFICGLNIPPKQGHGNIIRSTISLKVHILLHGKASNQFVLLFDVYRQPLACIQLDLLSFEGGKRSYKGQAINFLFS